MTAKASFSAANKNGEIQYLGLFSSYRVTKAFFYPRLWPMALTFDNKIAGGVDCLYKFILLNNVGAVVKTDGVPLHAQRADG